MPKTSRTARWSGEVKEAYKIKERDSNLIRKFKLYPSQYDKLLRSQNGVCAICGKPETSQDGRTKTTRRLAVDHDHKTGKVRGLLCAACNTATGLFKDSVEITLSAALYMERFSNFP